ncbi:MAG: aminotransferase class V-fold PLP-dependent enzyme [Pseudomonadota bacterium]
MTTSDKDDWQAFYRVTGLTPVINVSGTMTGLGASSAGQKVADACAAILPHFVKMHELQALASETIARLTGAEAGCVTASASAGITLSVAGTMTGLNPAAVERLPDTTGMKNEVVIQAGHLCHYGAPVEQSIRLAGATVIPVGQSTQVLDHQLAGAINERTAAAVYVVSHHVVDYGQIPFDAFVAICRQAGVPAIVDAASEYDLTGFIAAGADLAIYSAHKFLGGPTAGIVAGSADRVRAAYLQNMGIGRGMKVGKESIFGTIAALRDWEVRDHEAVRQAEREALHTWLEVLSNRPGIKAAIVPDPTDNPLDRLRVDIDPVAAGASARAVAAALAAGEPSVVVRDHEVEQGWIQLDPCNLLPGQQAMVVRRLEEVCDAASAGELSEPDETVWRNQSVNAYLNWGRP